MIVTPLDQRLAQEPILGQWINADKGICAIKRLIIARRGDEWSIEAWSPHGTSEVPYGKTALILQGEGAVATDQTRAVATWNEPALCTRSLTLHIENEELVGEISTVFTDHSRRPTVRRLERFTRVEMESPPTAVEK